MTPLLRAAAGADLPAVGELLGRSGLPTSDLQTSRPQFIVACEGENVVGVGALEQRGAAALLRSVAVAPLWRRSGLGHQIVRALERQARAAGIAELFLLTLTAQEFFEREGYRVVERAQVPPAVQESAEFRSLCPVTAVCMLKTLRRTDPL